MTTSEKTATHTPNDALRCSRCNSFHNDTLPCPPAIAHTPGPWKVNGSYARKTSNYDKTYRLAVLGPTQKTGTPTTAYGVGDTSDEARANANLIAAAPDLLRALKDALVEIEVNHDGIGAVVDVLEAQGRAAIEKAEGR